MPGVASSDRGLTVRPDQPVRPRLLQAGRAVFAQSGFAGSTVAEVTATAGVNRATFYAHFDSKTELLTALCTEVVASASPAWQRLDDVLVDADPERVREFLTAAADWWQRNGDILPALREAAAVDPAIAQWIDASFTSLAENLHRSVQGLNEPRRRRAVLTVQLLVVQLDQVMFDHIVLGIGDPDLPELLDLLTEIWVAAVRSW